MNPLYTRLPNGTLYAGPLDQSNMVGGTNEELRNSQHNPKRLKRIKQLNHSPRVLDYGCGNGLLVKYLRANDVWVDGYDPFSNIYNLPLPDSQYDIVTMVEVIEHTAEPYREIDDVFRILRPGGVVMIETSFSDFLEDDDPYLNPSIGHSTIFSYAGLDELMKSRGFEFGVKINRNVLCWVKPVAISLITVTQGNPRVLRNTLESVRGICDEVILGDVMIFDEDREIIKSYEEEFNLKIIPLPFNYIFKNGFAATLNEVASHAKNDLVMYLNVGEIIVESSDPVLLKIKSNYNAYYQDHSIEAHHWYRTYNRKNLKWGGILHEEVIGNMQRYPNPLFRFADLEKDMQSSFKAACYNDIKEIVYFQLYLNLVDHPELVANTHPGWVKYATDSYDDIKRRLLLKGKRYQAFIDGDLQAYLEDAYNNPDFEKERRESSVLINLQGARKDIL